MKNKGRMLKAVRKKYPYLQRNSHKAISGFLSRNLTGQGRVRYFIQSAERENCQPRILTWKSCPLEMKER